MQVFKDRERCLINAADHQQFSNYCRPLEVEPKCFVCVCLGTFCRWCGLHRASAHS